MIVAMVIVSLSLSLGTVRPAAATTGAAVPGVDGSVVLTSFDPFEIDGDDELVEMAAIEHWPGAGTAQDPIIIQNYSIDAGEAGNAVRITNTTLHLVLRNCTFQNALGSVEIWDAGAAALLYNVQNVRLEHCSYADVVYGVILVESDHVALSLLDGVTPKDSIYVQNCQAVTISSNQLVATGWGSALHIVGTEHSAINGNNVTDSNMGLDMALSSNNTIDRLVSYHTAFASVYLDRCNDLTLSNCTISDPSDRQCIFAENSNRTLVRDSVISNGGNAGIYLIDGRGNRLVDTTIRDCGTPGMDSTGVWIDRSEVSIQNCVITRNLGSGAFLRDVGGGAITDSAILDNNGIGLRVDGGSDLRVSGNSFIANSWDTTGGAVDMTGCSWLNISNNFFAENYGVGDEVFSGVAVTVRFSDNLTIANNWMRDAYGNAMNLVESERILATNNDMFGFSSTAVQAVGLKDSVIRDSDCRGATGGAVLAIGCRNLDVVNITCDGSNQAITLQNNILVNVTACNITNSNSYGIYATWSMGTGGVNISGNTLSNNMNSDIYVSGGTGSVISYNHCSLTGSHIYLEQAEGALLENNTCVGADAGRGLLLNDCTGCTVLGGSYSGLDTGIAVGYSQSCQILSVTFTDDDTGLEVYESAGNTVAGCTFTNDLNGIRSGAYPSSGGSSDMNVRGNTFTGCENGVESSSSHYFTVESNTFVDGAGYAVLLRGCFGWEIFNNTFVDNNGAAGAHFPATSSQALDGSGVNQWYHQSGETGWGNRWSDLRSIDVNGDGRVDCPYEIASGPSDEFPLPCGPAIEPPSAPVGLTASDTMGGVRLEWSPPSLLGNSTIVGYNVYRNNVNPESLDEHVLLAPYVRGLSYADTRSLQVGTGYSYRVVAVTSNELEGAIASSSVTYDPYPDPNHGPVRIDRDSDFVAQEWPGSGTEDEPYVIAGLIIDGGFGSDGIYVGNVTKHFIVRDCVVFQCARPMGEEPTNFYGYGIVLFNTSNGRLLSNELYGNGGGIYIRAGEAWAEEGGEYVLVETACDNILVSGNDVGYCVDNLGLNSEYASNVTVTGNAFHHNLYGLSTQEGENVTVSGNRFDNCTTGLALQSFWSTIDGNQFTGCTNAVFVRSSHHLSIRDMNITDAMSTGIDISSSNWVEVENVTVAGHENGLVLSGCNHLSITGGRFANNSLLGLQVAQCSYVQLTRCTFAGNQDGILVHESAELAVEGNTFHDNAHYGILLDGLIYGHIAGNRFVSGGSEAIYCEHQWGASLTEVYGNYFDGNGPGEEAPQVSMLVDVTWYNQSLHYGNYWSDWRSPDENHDGIVDTPYFEMDQFPLASRVMWPAELTAHPGRDYVRMEWSTPVVNFGVEVTGYRLYRGDSPGSEEFLANVAGLWYNDTGLAFGNTYYYRVAALYSGGEGPKSPVIAAITADTPGQVADLTALGGIRNIELRWNMPVEDGGSPILGYNIYRGTSPGSETLLATLVDPDTSYVDQAVGDGETYYYFVRAYSQVGEGAASEGASASSYDVPGVPRQVTLAFGNGTISVSWLAPVSDGGLPIAGYVVYVRPINGQVVEHVASGEARHLNVTGLNNGLEYTVWIRAVNDVGVGPSSEPLSETPATTPSFPWMPVTTGGDSTILLAWNAPFSNGGADIIQYLVYRRAVDGPEALLGTTAVTSYQDDAAENGVIYYYRVVAVNKVGPGQSSPVVSGVAGLPLRPTNLTAEAGSGSIVLTWDAPSETGGSPITDYKVYRVVGNAMTALEYIGHIGSASTTYEDSLVQFGVTYYYKVSAVTALGEGQVSGEANARVNETAPLAPRNLAVVIADGVATLNWDAPLNGSKATSYLVYRGTSTGAEALIGRTVGLTTVSYVDLGYSPYQVFYYKVRGTNALGEGPFSNEVNTSASAILPPSAPAGLSALASSGTVQLSWSAPLTGAPVSVYNIYRGTAEGEYALVATTTSPGYVDHGLTNGITYHYRVSANNTAGEGANASASATPVTVPTAPHGLAANDGLGQVVVSWSAPSSDGGSPVLAYFLYRGTSPGSSTFLATVSGLTYTDTALAAGTTYYYVVKAANAVGDGPWSGEAHARTFSIPYAPTDLTAVGGARNVTVSWSAPVYDGGSPITGYRVYLGAATVPVATVTGTSHVLTGLTDGTSYLVRVAAFNAVGQSAEVTAAASTLGVPSAVGALQAQEGNTEVLLSWAPPSSDGGSPVTGYAVYVGTTPGALSLSLSATGRSCTVAGLTNGVTYHFAVVAVSAVGNGTPAATSAAPGTVPSAPHSPFAAQGEGAIELNWSAPASDGGSAVTSFRVYRGTSPTGQMTYLGSTNWTRYTDDTAAAGATYYYRVSAANAFGEGERSAAAEGTLALPATDVPGAVGRVNATSQAGSVLLAWSAPAAGGSDITAYRVYRGTSLADPVLVATVPGTVTSFSDVGTSEGQTYYYWVVAENDAGPGPMPGAAITGTVGAKATAPATSGADNTVLYAIIGVLAALQAVTLFLALRKK